jgi:hypothetical protein
MMVTLGLWDDLVGRPFVGPRQLPRPAQPLARRFRPSGDKRPLVGPPTSTTSTGTQANYLTSMSYLFRVIGLF